MERAHYKTWGPGSLRNRGKLHWAFCCLISSFFVHAGINQLILKNQGFMKSGKIQARHMAELQYLIFKIISRLFFFAGEATAEGGECCFCLSGGKTQWCPPPWQSWQDLLGSTAQLQELPALQVSCSPFLPLPPYPLLLAALHALLLLSLLGNLASYFPCLSVLLDILFQKHPLTLTKPYAKQMF